MRRQSAWAPLAVGVAILIAAAAWHRHAVHATEPGAVLVAGGDAGGLPRADAGPEGFDARALHAAVETSRVQQAGALLITRHGHLVVESYGGSVDADTLVEGGEFSRTLLMLAVGVAVAREGPLAPAVPSGDPAQLTALIFKASGLSYPRFLSRNVWQPLNAAPAQCSGTGVRARPVDWLRVAELLLHDGRFEGTQVVPRGWVQQLRPTAKGVEQPGTGIYIRPVTTSAEAFASDGTFFLRGPGGTRLWLVPRLDLAILQVGSSGARPTDETHLPNAVVRALRDRPPSTGVELRELVPNH
jgi:hypothetical protein